MVPESPTFEVCDDGVDADVVLAGFSEFGLAGLTAVEYLAERLDLEACGFVAADSIPTITPFEAGRPHHHTRILTRPDLDVAVLHSGLSLPRTVAPEFGRAVVDWTIAASADEVAVLTGVPFAHGPEAHRTFHVATADYHAARLDDADVDVPAMENGYLDGVNGALVERGMRSDLAVGVFVTPVHDQVPDVDAAIRLVDTITDVYDLDVDTGELEAFAADVQSFYEKLRERLEKVPDEDRQEDRMFM